MGQSVLTRTGVNTPNPKPPNKHKTYQNMKVFQLSLCVLVASLVVSEGAVLKRRRIVKKRPRGPKQLVAVPAVAPQPIIPVQPAIQVGPHPSLTLNTPHHAARILHPAVRRAQALSAVQVPAPAPVITPLSLPAPTPLPFVPAPAPIVETVRTVIPPPVPAPIAPVPLALPAPVPVVEVKAAPAPSSYAQPIAEPIVEVVAEPIVEVKAAPAPSSYAQHIAEPIVEVRAAPRSYLGPAAAAVPAPAPLAPLPLALPAPAPIVPTPPPVAFRSVCNAPGTQLNDLDAWNYAFEADNGIRQEATGVMKAMDDGAQVMVMSGSYEYIGADSLTYIVDWVADENGFRASAPHLPKSVPIPFPEVQAAVDAQLAFAAANPEPVVIEVARSAELASYGR